MSGSIPRSAIFSVALLSIVGAAACHVAPSATAPEVSSPAAEATSAADVPCATGSPHAVSSASPGHTPAAVAPAQLLRKSRVSQATHAERDHYLYLPAGFDASGDQRWPVLLFLHGNGERGDAKADLDYLLKNGPLYEAWIQKRDLPFIVIAPQLPMYGMDEKVDYLRKRTRSEIPERLPSGVPDRPAEFATPSPMKGALAAELPSTSTPYGPPMGWPELDADLLALLDDVLANYKGDPSRQYLTGVSYGGFGTWYVASKHPERFAAIVPVVGYGHPELMGPIAQARLPIWCFAGGRDSAVRTELFYPGLNRLEALGHEARFSIEADMGHDVWARVYAGNDIYDWMLAHHKVAVSSRAVAP
jgi:pimeloyl-ACP methyl ester carboxylesterase